MKRLALIGLFPLRFYAYLTEPASVPAPAELVLPSPEPAPREPVADDLVAA
jgi:hypothetical protein